MMDKGERQLQQLAVFVHGILVAFHTLGIVYNVKKRNWGDVACHTCATVYDCHAVGKHIRALEKP